MNIEKSLTYVFEDEEWLMKLGLGTLITMVPVLNFAWTGYVTEIMRNVGARSLRPLPTWDDLGTLLVDGFSIFIARLIYALPALLMLFAPLVLMILPALSSNQDVQSVLAIISGGTALLLFVGFFLYLLLLSFFAPAVQLNYARHRTFGACFQVGQILQLVSTNLSNYVIAWISLSVLNLGVYLIFSLVSGFVGLIPCIGVMLSLALIPVYLFAGMWMGTVSAYLFGQLLQAQ